MADTPEHPLDARIKKLRQGLFIVHNKKPAPDLTDDELLEASRTAEGVLRFGTEAQHPMVLLAVYSEISIRIAACKAEQNKLPNMFGLSTGFTLSGMATGPLAPSAGDPPDVIEEGPAEPAQPLFQPGTGMKRTAKD